jgi:hypothetical protein
LLSALQKLEENFDLLTKLTSINPAIKQDPQTEEMVKKWVHGYNPQQPAPAIARLKGVFLNLGHHSPKMWSSDGFTACVWC